MPYEPAPEGAARLDMLVVQAEVCLRVALPPTNKQPNVQVGRRYGPHGEGRSVGGSIIEPAASTPAGQAVFESFDAYRQTDTLGYVVWSAPDDPAFVYFLEHADLTQEWSQWEAPQAVAMRRFDVPLWGPARLKPDGNSSPEAPRMRFRLARFKDDDVLFERQHSDPKELSPPC